MLNAASVKLRAGVDYQSSEDFGIGVEPGCRHDSEGLCVGDVHCRERPRARHKPERVRFHRFRLIRFRHFYSGSLALASLNLACRNPVPAFPQRSPPLLLTTAACGGLRSTPDCRPRRTFLHLSYSCATPFGPAILVTQDPTRTSVRISCRSSEVGFSPLSRRARLVHIASELW
jgi:hypothetical protein